MFVHGQYCVPQPRPLQLRCGWAPGVTGGDQQPASLACLCLLEFAVSLTFQQIMLPFRPHSLFLVRKRFLSGESTACESLLRPHTLERGVSRHFKPFRSKPCLKRHLLNYFLVYGHNLMGA